MTRPLTVVIAPDSFKGSLPAAEVAAAIGRGWSSVRGHDTIVSIPQADGGEGTLDAIRESIPGSTLHDVPEVTGPDGRPTPSRWLELPNRVGVVELGVSSGIALMRSLDPLGATTRGLGETVRHALEYGVDSLIIGLGSSASTDGGAGALAALGLELRGGDGDALPDGGGALASLASVGRAHLIAPPPGGVTLLTDVDAPLLGPRGAAAVFGPQKGATEAQVATLDAALSTYSEMLGGDPTLPGSGAAGGTAFAFASVWGATVEPGAAYIAALSGLTDAAITAEVILTGEGKFDATSSTGKVVGSLFAVERGANTQLGVIAGQLAAETDAWAIALTDIADSVDEAIAHPIPALEEAGRRAARHFAATPLLSTD